MAIRPDEITSVLKQQVALLSTRMILSGISRFIAYTAKFESRHQQCLTMLIYLFSIFRILAHDIIPIFPQWH